MEDNHGATSSSSYFTYDVFLSFRGDTRHTFTDHLYHALTNKGVKTFRDDPELRLGDEIRPSVVDAIERSRMSIVVLSERYAHSSWCLDELVKIMECKQDKGTSVLPIFYQVDPSDVRHQREQYKINIMKHEHRFAKHSHKLKAWRSALSAVADLAGKHCKDRSESDIIEEIVREVLEKLPGEPLHIKHTAELDLRLEEVKSLLNIEDHDTLCLLCIYGEGETEKSTFVGLLYNKIFHQFEVPCFLANVSEKSKESINGLENLQKTLVSMIDHKAKNDMGSTFRGCSEIKRRLGNKRVLLILDDVDSVDQLDSLAGGGDWFGPGSRIIITTRDEDLANKHLLHGVETKKYCIDECDSQGSEAAKLSNNKQKLDVEEGDVVGFDSSLSIVINQLKKEDSLHNVVSITGMGGLGKTTLAQKIYNNNDIKKLFPCCAWSCVSKDYNERNVLLNLLSCLKPSTSMYEKFSKEKLKEEVRKCLDKNKYLVVLDDIWEPEVWDKVKDVFPNNNNGSMILITSRNDEVAYYTRSRRPHHKLPSLNVEESWELFCKKVFGKEECPSHLEPIGRSIVERCGGLPLAIITLAGLVAKKERSYIEWSQIKDFVPWYLAEDNSKVMDVLKVSYNNLPETLKPCFLYFGIYPEDYKILTRELVQLWIAEGFIKPEKTATSNVPKLEDVGDRYLKELVDRNLVQVVARRSDGGVKICSIHDLLHQLCILESKADKFLEVCTESKNNLVSNSCRLSFWCNEQYYMSLIKCSQSSTRSLFFFRGEKFPEDVMESFPLVHVLHVKRKVLFNKDPRDLKKMIHLKYLRIEQGNCLREIPNWIWSLYNLETLDVRGWAALNTTITIWKMERLRHVYTRLFAQLGGNKGRANSSKRMWNLQTLSRVKVEPQTMLLLNKGCFPNLTKLTLTYNSSIDHPPEKLWNLHNLSKLGTFKIDCCYARISLDGIVFPSSISKITLTHFQLDSGCMSVLGKIGSLRILKLVDGSTETETLDCGTAGDFPQLLVFHLERLNNVKSLTMENGAMPLLQRMVYNKYFLPLSVPKRLASLSASSMSAGC